MKSTKPTAFALSARNTKSNYLNRPAHADKQSHQRRNSGTHRTRARIRSRAKAGVDVSATVCSSWTALEL